MEHTPTPWKSGADFVTFEIPSEHKIYAPDGSLIAKFYSPGGDPATNRDFALVACNSFERLREALRDVLRLAQVSFDGDPYYAEQAGLDGDAILDEARAVLSGAPIDTNLK